MREVSQAADKQSAGRNLPGQSRTHRVDDLSVRGNHTERREGAAIDHSLIFHEDLVLAVAPVNHFDFDSQVVAKFRRHPDGVKTRQSIRAIANCNSGHSSSVR